MAQIIRDTKQDEALSRIAAGMAEITRINNVISGEKKVFKLQSMGDGKGKFDIPESLNDKVVAVLKDRKKELVKAVRAEAKANKIRFDAKEEEAMTDAGFAKKPVKVEAEQEEQHEPEQEDIASAESAEEERDDLDLL